MASLLETNAPMSSEISMILQLAALAVIVIGSLLARRRKYPHHGALMFVATLLNIASVAAVMIPVTLRIGSTATTGFYWMLIPHIILGVIVIAISVWIVAEWRFQKPGPTCFQRKKWMLGLALVWSAQLILGMLIFLELYPY